LGFVLSNVWEGSSHHQFYSLLIFEIKSILTAALDLYYVFVRYLKMLTFILFNKIYFLVFLVLKILALLLVTFFRVNPIHQFVWIVIGSL